MGVPLCNPTGRQNIIHMNRIRFMVFSATFNNISAISWWSVLLVEETGVPDASH
jgi:hypothetical protein